jgi:hypothetical protein
LRQESIESRFGCAAIQQILFSAVVWKFPTWGAAASNAKSAEV